MNIAAILKIVPLELLILLGLLIILQLFVSANSSAFKSPVLAHARWAKNWEISAALRIAQKQAQKRKIDETALFLGDLETGWRPHLNIFLGKNNNFIPLPHMQRSLITFGTPNAGKTTTIAKPLIKDIIRRNLGSIILFDPKSDLAPTFAPFAEAHGYDNYFLAPGRKYTDSINFFSFFDREEWLSSIAEQMAKTTIRNTKDSQGGSSDPFFGNSGISLLRSILMLTQLNFDEPNLLITKEILALPDLIERLRYAEANGRISPWVSSSLRQFMSGESSERTIASIQSTASLVFDGFIRPEFMNAYCNPTNIPLELTEKQMIVIQPMRGFEDVCMPMLSTFMDLIIERNFVGPRKKPLFLIIDELHLAYLPRLSRWLAFLRSSGLVMILLTQAMSQIQGTYGENEFNTIYNSAGTKIIMNPDDSNTATATSNRLGNKEVRYQQKSRSYTRSGSSRSKSEQIQQVPLKTAEEINQMDVGEFICWNWGFQKQGKTAIPLHIKYPVPQHEFDLDQRCQTIWNQKYLDSLIAEAKKTHKTPEELDNFLQTTINKVRALLPTPEIQDSSTNKTTKKDQISNSDIHKLRPEEKGILSKHANRILTP